jgi:hypothetical protein
MGTHSRRQWGRRDLRRADQTLFGLGTLACGSACFTPVAGPLGCAGGVAVAGGVLVAGLGLPPFTGPPRDGPSAPGLRGTRVPAPVVAGRSTGLPVERRLMVAIYVLGVPGRGVPGWLG